MIELKPYNYENRLGRCTNRDEYGNADVKGVNMSFMLGLPYEEMAILAQALNRLADFEDAEIAEDKKLREKSNKKMSDDLISRQAAIDIVFRSPFFSDSLMEELRALPSVQSKTGHWIERVDEQGDVYYECSNCEEAFTFIDGTPADNLYNHCPNCGAKMEEIE